jgi:hypothetical protein
MSPHVPFQRVKLELAGAIDDLIAQIEREWVGGIAPSGHLQSLGLRRRRRWRASLPSLGVDHATAASGNWCDRFYADYREAPSLFSLHPLRSPSRGDRRARPWPRVRLHPEGRPVARGRDRSRPVGFGGEVLSASVPFQQNASNDPEFC